MSDDAFYAGLPEFHHFHELTEARRYTPLPASWLVVITDVRNSTRAVADGKYKDVNALGVASIVAVLNVVKPLKIPYIFGGDGATLCVPLSVKEKVEAALAGTRLMGESSFGLSLRTGIVDMKTILDAGRSVLVGKFKPAPHYEQAMLKGDGLAYAESLVKDPNSQNPYLIQDHPEAGSANFSGFECRWNEVPSPRGETVSLLIKASDDQIYSDIIEKILTIYGKEEDHHPLRVDQLTLNASLKKLGIEARIKAGTGSFLRRWQKMLNALFWVMAGKTMNIKQYKQTLIANTDYRKFDGVLRMVISGGAEQRSRLKNFLDELRKTKKIIYGLHVDPSALITCIIGDYTNDHVHFVDGSNGGYTLAAEEMKRQR